jgi:hypothetical protein
MSTGLLVRLDEAVVGRLWLNEKRHFCFQPPPQNLWVEGGKN